MSEGERAVVRTSVTTSPGTDARALLRASLRAMWRAPSQAAFGLVRLYQLTLSPMLGPACRFHPSCSHYACACLRDHGLVWGGVLSTRRILRCQPFHPGGFDPPPPPRARGVWTWLVLGASSPRPARALTSDPERGAS